MFFLEPGKKEKSVFFVFFAIRHSPARGLGTSPVLCVSPEQLYHGCHTDLPVCAVRGPRRVILCKKSEEFRILDAIHASENSPFSTFAIVQRVFSKAKKPSFLCEKTFIFVNSPSG